MKINAQVARALFRFEFNFVYKSEDAFKAIQKACVSGNEVFLHIKKPYFRHITALKKSLWKLGFGTQDRGNVSDYRILRVYWDRFLTPLEAQRLDENDRFL